MNPTWYDVLDVEPTATAEKIRAAWQALVAELGPTDRRFRVVNEAAEVLLDPERRAAYDAELAGVAAPVEADPEPEPPASPVPAADEPPTSLELQHIESDRTPRGGIPGWLLIGVAIVAAAALVATGLVWRSTRSDGDVEAATSSARSAAERAVVPILSYDYRHMNRSQAAAEAYMTGDYKKKYDQLFAVLKKNAPATKTIVNTEVLASGIVRSGDDRVSILVFVDRPTTNADTKTPQVYHDQATLFMELVDGDWLVDCMVTSAASTCD